jgi:hypothetical protein
VQLVGVPGSTFNFEGDGSFELGAGVALAVPPQGDLRFALRTVTLAGQLAVGAAARLLVELPDPIYSVATFAGAVVVQQCE